MRKSIFNKISKNKHMSNDYKSNYMNFRRNMVKGKENLGRWSNKAKGIITSFVISLEYMSFSYFSRRQQSNTRYIPSLPLSLSLSLTG